jgi:hypothetical protein
MDEFRNPVTPPQPCDSPRGWYRKDGSLRGSDQPVPGKCGRHLRGTDPPRYCLESPLQGRETCKFHSGRAKAGIASPHYRHGRRSKYLKRLPKDVGAAYKAALADPSLISLRDELALQESKIADLCGQLDREEAPPWGQAVEAFNDFKLAVASKDVERFRVALAALETIIRTGAGAAARQAEVWAELREVIQEKTRTVAVETKRLVDVKALVSVEDAMAFAKAFLVAARELILDRDLLARLQERTLKLLPAE